jgi:hypothetical protein
VFPWLDPGRCGVLRTGGLDDTQRALYRTVLRSFAAGDSTAIDALLSACRPAADAGALAALVSADLIRRGPEHVEVAYPFSAAPSDHQVVLAGGHAPHAMCAFDALGIPFLASLTGAVHTRDPWSGERIQVRIDPSCPDRFSASHLDAVLTVRRSGPGGIAEGCCPVMWLFTSHVAAARYVRERALTDVTLVGLGEAIAGAGAMFAGLLG